MSSKQTHNGIPFRGWHYGHPIPDLERLSEDRWPEALRQVPSDVRWTAARRLARPEDAPKVVALILDIDGEDAARRKALDRAVAFPPPLPGARAPARARRRQRQINFRLTADEHDRVAEAATLLGMKPTAFARLLTLRGTWQVIAEAQLGSRDGQGGDVPGTPRG